MENIDNRIQELIPYLKKRALGICNYDKEVAEDLFQEAFLKIWTHRTKFVHDTSLKGWCTTIMFNTYIDEYKANIKRNNIREQGSQIEHNSAESSISLDDIYSTIDEHLSPINSYIVKKVLQGFKHKEIGEQLGLERNNVKQHYFQAIRRIRPILKDKFNLDDEFGLNDGLKDVHKAYKAKSYTKNKKKY